MALKGFVALLLLVLVGGLFQFKTDPSCKPQLLNLFGLNPTVRFVGKVAPDIAMKDLKTGKTVHLKDFRGKVVLLEFWASWCPDCLRQLPTLQKLYKDPAFKNKVQFLTVNIKDPQARNPAQLKAWLRARHYTFPVLLGGMDVLKVYNVRFLPTLLVLTSKGQVLQSSPEYHSETSVRKWLQQAIRLSN